MSASLESPGTDAPPRLSGEDEQFLREFETAILPRDQWHHREHVKVAYLYLMRHPVDEAMARMRAGIRKLNAAHGTPETPTRGYHETTTQAWLRLVHLTLREHGPALHANDFYEQHPELSQPKILRLFYSRELLNSVDARAKFMAPDLAPLPVPRNK